MTIVRKQEDSYFKDIKQTDGSVFDADWSGKWQIIDITDTIVANGIASLSVDTYSMEYRIKKVDTVSLLGNYTITFELTNVTLGYQKEFDESIEFVTQNIN